MLRENTRQATTITGKGTASERHAPAPQRRSHDQPENSPKPSDSIP
jgi:hypothetical protein